MLITGATSSIGLIGLQIARALGAGQIIATTRSAAKHDLPNSLDWQPHSRLASTMRRRSDPATPTGGEE
ncbi:hypothetical protein ACFC0I_39205, partial [Streptomyces sp. NPDC056227]